MSWYGKISSSSMIKYAVTDAVADNQDGSYDVLFDVKRYVMDSYTVKTAISTTGNNIGVTLLCNHAFLGTIAWDAYWTFELENAVRAKKLYIEINKIIKEICESFVENETTTAIFWPTLRSKVEMLEKDKQAATYIPSINYARNIAIEPDWRSNIYGTRYPKYTEPNYSQEVKFWAKQRD